MTTTTRIASYARVSVQDGTSHSVAEQLEVLRALVVRQGGDLVAEFVDDGVSASAFAGGRARPGFQDLVRMVTAGELDAVAVFEQSRFARDLGQFAAWRDLCARQGVVWLTPSGVVDPGRDSDRLGAGVLALVDETASRQTSARVRRTMAAQAAKGAPHGRHVYGLRRVYSATRALVAVEVVEDEALVIRRLALELLAGASLRGLAGALEAEGVPAPAVAIARRTGRETPLGATVWQPQAIKRILLSEAVAGRRTHRGEIVDAAWPAILDDATHRRLRDLLTDPARGTAFRGRELTHPLAGVLRCGACDGGLYVLDRAHGGPAYCCRARGCYRVAISKAAVEAVVVDLVMRAVQDERFVRHGDDRRLAELRVEATKLRRRLEEATAEFMAGRLTARLLGRIEGEAEAGLAALDAQSRALRLPAALPDPAVVLNRWGDLGAERQRHVIRLTLGDRIVVRPAGRKRVPPLTRLVFPDLGVGAE